MADRQSGGIAWMFWDRGEADARAAQIRDLRAAVAALDAALAALIEVLTNPAP